LSRTFGIFDDTNDVCNLTGLDADKTRANLDHFEEHIGKLLIEPMKVIKREGRFC
jgi:hypothetical protein